MGCLLSPFRNSKSGIRISNSNNIVFIILDKVVGAIMVEIVIIIFRILIIILFRIDWSKYLRFRESNILKIYKYYVF